MVYKHLVLPALLSAGLLLSANAAQAQRGGGGHGGGGAHAGSAHGGGAYHGGAYHGGAYHGGAYHGGYYGGYRGPVIGIGLYGGGYGYGGGGYYGGGYDYPYAYPYDYPVVVPRVAYYPAPIIGQLAPSDPQPAAAATTVANIRVLVPDGQAKVWFDGALTTQSGTDRSYHTPSLSGAGPFSYRIRAAWIVNGKEVVQENVAQVTPGQTTTVDFTRPVSEPLPAPKRD